MIENTVVRACPKPPPKEKKQKSGLRSNGFKKKPGQSQNSLQRRTSSLQAKATQKPKTSLSVKSVKNPDSKRTFGNKKGKRAKDSEFSATTRRKIRKRDDDFCVCCGRRVEHIHHITFRSQLGKGTEDNGVCVCGYCHEWAHKQKVGRFWFELFKVIAIIAGETLPKNLINPRFNPFFKRLTIEDLEAILEEWTHGANIDQTAGTKTL